MAKEARFDEIFPRSSSCAANNQQPNEANIETNEEEASNGSPPLRKQTTIRAELPIKENRNVCNISRSSTNTSQAQPKPSPPSEETRRRNLKRNQLARYFFLAPAWWVFKRRDCVLSSVKKKKKKRRGGTGDTARTRFKNVLVQERVCEREGG